MPAYLSDREQELLQDLENLRRNREVMNREIKNVLRTLADTRVPQAEIARKLGVSRQRVGNMMRELGINYRR